MKSQPNIIGKPKPAAASLIYRRRLSGRCTGSNMAAECGNGGSRSNALAIPQPPMGRLKHNRSLGAHIPPPFTVPPTGKQQRVIFAFVADT